MPFLQQGQSAQVSVPGGQYLRVTAIRGAQASVSAPLGRPGGPLLTVADGEVVLPMPAGAATLINVSAAVGEVEYVVNGAATDQRYNPGAVAVSGGTINAATVGATTPSTGNFTSLRHTSLASALTDGSGTPGNVTQNVAHGRAAFPAAAASVVVTNSLVAANSSVFVQLGGTDATLTCVRVTTAAGSFTVTGDAAATGIVPFSYLVLNN
jgi:hypothetical protein